jgi:hypothetical protein
VVEATFDVNDVKPDVAESLLGAEEHQRVECLNTRTP